jgi:hypothetical protein
VVSCFTAATVSTHAHTGGFLQNKSTSVQIPPSPITLRLVYFPLEVVTEASTLRLVTRMSEQFIRRPLLPEFLPPSSDCVSRLSLRIPVSSRSIGIDGAPPMKTWHGNSTLDINMSQVHYELKRDSDDLDRMEMSHCEERVTGMHTDETGSKIHQHVLC